MKKNAFALSSAMFPSAVPSDWEECRSLLNHINIIMIMFQFNKQINIIVYS